jgi:hypothetical protein
MIPPQTIAHYKITAKLGEGVCFDGRSHGV